ncbi:TPA: DEAD/DEAH box helicase [archaeon]|jgi:ATP-dependent RNA helicase DeaD|uniref:DEAD/DEAH box helicase n=1 Tax=Candidatus Undinarchaeum marinum TaxID=2756141 RepID=A0A832ULK5_9ARCH|nr:DEAD/DEAH box helicase [Candidatus Undinarchaeum marinum]
MKENTKKVEKGNHQKPTPDATKTAINLSSVEAFKNLGITEDLLISIAEQGFVEPTEIQTKSIPSVLSGMDLMAKASTGSGKTLAFGSGIIQNSERKKGLQALVLTPTRELAIQAAKALQEFSKHKSLSVSAIYGGVSIRAQIQALRRVEIAIGTPGRLLDHMERGTIQLDNLKTLVLDEADRMLDMGFIDDVQKIIRACPKDRQTLLFSATLSSGVKKLARKYMRDPQEVFAESYVDPAKLEQCYYDVDDRLKFSLLLHLLKNEESELVMVFCNTRRFVDFVSKELNKNGVNATAIHGGFRQAKRTKTMDRFHSQNVQVLVCTDVAARGLDIPMVSHVYNFDIPKESNQYIHRIGRTARAGKEGKVINILGSRDYENFRKVKQESIGDIPRAEVPQFEQIIAQISRGRSQKPRYGGGNRRGPQRGGSQRSGPQRGGSHRRTGSHSHSSKYPRSRSSRRPTHRTSNYSKR